MNLSEGRKVTITMGLMITLIVLLVSASSGAALWAARIDGDIEALETAADVQCQQVEAEIELLRASDMIQTAKIEANEQIAHEIQVDIAAVRADTSWMRELLQREYQ